jgi:hypothetical protein
MTNVPAKPTRDSNTVRTNAPQTIATRARPNVIAVTRHASSRSRRIGTAPRQVADPPFNCKEFSAVSFFQGWSERADGKVFRIHRIFKTSNRHNDCSMLMSLLNPNGEEHEL